MSKWHLLASLGIACVGALLFLRVVANEIALREGEIEQRRKSETARKPPSGLDRTDEEIVATRAA